LKNSYCIHRSQFAKQSSQTGECLLLLMSAINTLAEYNVCGSSFKPVV